MTEEQTREFVSTLPTLQDKIWVFKDIIPTKAQALLYSLAIQDLDWKIGGSLLGTSGFDLSNDKKMSESFQFTSLVLDRTHDNPRWGGFGMEGGRDDSSYNFLLPLQFGAIKLGTRASLDKVLRCKLNFQTRVLPHKRGKYNFPHTDFSQIDGTKFFTAIYYVNDSDGDTFIFNEKHIIGVDMWNNKGEPNNDYLKIIQNLTIRERIKPKKGKLIIFRGDTLHAGCHPIDNDYRCVINYNFFPSSMIKANTDYDMREFRKIFGDID